MQCQKARSWETAKMSAKPWSGETELQAALQDLCGQYPVPASKIRQAVTVANKYSTEFKMVVYEIERFIKHAQLEDKIAGVFVMDSLCRQHSKERETFAKRFAVRLKDTASFLTKISGKDKAAWTRFVEEWRKKDVFPASLLSAIAPHTAAAVTSPPPPPRPPAFPAPTPAPATGSMQQQQLLPTIDQLLQEAEEDEPLLGAAPSSSSSLTSPPAGTAGAASSKEPLRPAVKCCPFREGCPFGDKCRFSHHDSNTLAAYALRLPLGPALRPADHTHRDKRPRREEEKEEVLAVYSALLGVQGPLRAMSSNSSSGSGPQFQRLEGQVDLMLPGSKDVHAYELTAAHFDQLLAAGI